MLALRNIKITFQDYESEKWFEKVLNEWTPRTNTIIYIPCASKKPFHKAPSHKSRRKFRVFWDLWIKDLIDLIIVSEPLTVVPAEFDYPVPIYPIYDYPVKLIKGNNHFAEKERNIWRQRFEKFARKHSDKECFFLLYPYHRKILGDILEKYCKAGLYVERPCIPMGTSYLLRIIEDKSFGIFKVISQKECRRNSF